jgi:hypothetical protein
MTTNEAFLHALNHEKIKGKYAASSIRTWRSRALRDKLSLDFMVEFLNENGFKIKQSMQWQLAEIINTPVNGKTEHHHSGDNTHHEKDYKTQLSKKLYAVRKQLSAELFNNWYEWSKAEYSKDFPSKKTELTPVVFSQMTYGRYISKENIPFALKILKEGKKILHDYHDYIKREVESL